MCAIELFHSEKDCGYVAAVPELAGCSAFGETEEAALREVMTAIELWLETAGNLGIWGERSHNPEEESYYERLLMGLLRCTLHVCKGLSWHWCT